MSLKDRIDELETKAGNYDRLKEEYDKLINGIKEAVKILSNITGQDFSIKSEKGKCQPIKPFLNKIYLKFKIEDNFQLNGDQFKKEAELAGLNLNQHSVYNYFSKLGLFPGIKKIKNPGEKTRLFYQKPSEEKTEPETKIASVNHMG